MSLLDRPASSVFSTPTTLTASYSVLSREGTLVTLSNKGGALRKLKVGDLVRFNEGINGYVIDIAKDIAKVETGSTEEVNVATAYRLIPNTLTTVRVITEKEYGSLYVKCSNTVTKRPGHVGWTLYGPTDQVIAIGSDYNHKDVCQLTGDGEWSPGLYRLKVASFGDGSARLFSASKTWSIERPTTMLSIGDYSNSSLSLILR